MPEGDNEQENWQPHRGPVFKAVVWTLLGLTSVTCVLTVLIALLGS